MGGHELSLRWLSVTCFEMKIGGMTIVTDPFVTDSPGTDLTADVIEGVDLILLTHAHWDHVTDIPLLMRRFEPKLLLGEFTAMPMAKWLNCSASRVYPMPHGLELDFDSVKVKALYGRHTDLHEPIVDSAYRVMSSPLLSAKNDNDLRELQWWGMIEYRNFLITTRNGVRVLLWGNDPTIEQRNLLKNIRPDIALLQFSRQDPMEMAAFASDIGTKVFIPHHMDLKLKPEEYEPRVEVLRKEFLKREPNAAFICPKHGQWYDF